MDIHSELKKHKIIAIIRGVGLEEIIHTAKALYEGGIRFIEVTFNQNSPTCLEDTAEAIKEIISKLDDDVFVGAGTVMTEDQVEVAVNAGAKYIISPNFDKKVVRKTLDMGVISMPGALTSSEIVEAYNYGAHYIKLFPISQLGLSYIKAVKAPLSHIPMLAVGGVNVDNFKEALETGIVGAGIGSGIVNHKYIESKQFDKITELARQFTSQIS